jgi:hypothetical protein
MKTAAAFSVGGCANALLTDDFRHARRADHYSE